MLQVTPEPRLAVAAAILKISRSLFNNMQRPSADDLPGPLRSRARFVATNLRDAGFEAWVVGGAIRDLVLGRVPVEIDMTTDATPERIEELFPRTTAVGKAFGTIVVQGVIPGGMDDVELTTFRTDGDYVDGRRPEEVVYGTSVEEDAQRRDFTCNALYLDPLTGDFQDPERGMADLAAGVLRAVGEPVRRFREDGLRILRLARFTSSLGLVADSATKDAARAERDNLGKVSAERILAELIRIFRSEAPVRSLRLLHECAALTIALPELRALHPPGHEAEAFLELRLSTLEILGRPAEVETGLAVLLDPDPLREAGGESAERITGRARGALESLRPSRATRGQVTAIWHLQRILWRALFAERTRSEKVRMFRHPAWPAAREALTAWLTATSRPGLESIEAFEVARSQLSAEELHPAPLLTSDDLDAAGIDRGPRWGELLREAETCQLDGLLKSRDDALRWLGKQG